MEAVISKIISNKRIEAMILVEIAGFLGMDPEERFTANGKRVVTLRVATRVHQGGKDETVWWKVSIWDDRFDKMLSHLKKGSAVIIIGEMSKPEVYTSRDGVAQVSLNITATMIKFSPFSRPDRPAESPGVKEAKSDMQDSMEIKQERDRYAGAGVSHEGIFAGDDLPF
jgi:single-strand DNA-binding protein